jgi:hypothetical protein
LWLTPIGFQIIRFGAGPARRSQSPGPGALLQAGTGDIGNGKEPIPAPEDRARYSREHVGCSYIGWLHFQTVYEQLVAENPDMFD